MEQHGHSAGASLPRDLNQLQPEWDCKGSPPDPAYISSGSQNAQVEVYLRDIEWWVCRHISTSPVVVGCVAWLTSETILRHLARVDHGVSIVVQKEDFLRPDVDPASGWRKKLRTLYDAIPSIGDRYRIAGRVGELSVQSDPRIQSIRCVGNHNADKLPAFPRMHNKFLVFCDRLVGHDGDTLIPKAVWTGSYNLTANAGMSLENAVYIKDDDVAGVYFNQWEHIVSLSEPLDWTSEWCAPEWRIGS